VLAHALDPSTVKVCAVLVAGNRHAVGVVKVPAVDDDGQLHLTILPAAIS
jgi:hypothetical protein